VFSSIFVASCGAQRLRDAAEVLRQDPRVTSTHGPLLFTGSYGCVSALAAPEVAAELAHRFNVQWADSGPISLASASARRDPPTWWLRPFLGKDHQPRDPRWRGQWPIRLLMNLARFGIDPDGVRLSRQGKGLWLSGAGDATAARKAAAALHLEGSFRAGTATALYRMGPVDDPASLESHAAESLLRATLRDVGRRLAAADPADDHADAEPYDAFSVAAGFVLSEPAIRTIDDADWIVWVGEGGPRTRRRQATAPGLAAPRRECLQDASIHGARWRTR
jgi:hypothetical protein